MGPRDQHFSKTGALASSKRDIISIELCAGIGTASHALQALGAHAAHYMWENDDKDPSMYLTKTLRHHFPSAVIRKDIKELLSDQCSHIKQILRHHSKGKKRLRGIITAGFPCQDLSSAGLQQGLGGSRSILFATVAAIIAAFQREAKSISKETGCQIDIYFISENVASMQDTEKAILDNVFQSQHHLIVATPSHPTTRNRLWWTISGIDPMEAHRVDPIPQSDCLPAGWVTCQSSGFFPPQRTTPWSTFLKALHPGAPRECPIQCWSLSPFAYSINDLIV